MPETSSKDSILAEEEANVDFDVSQDGEINENENAVGGEPSVSKTTDTLQSSVVSGVIPCDWASLGVCTMSGLAPMVCQRE